jgi:hypothetical protein
MAAHFDWVTGCILAIGPGLGLTTDPEAICER